MLEIVIILYLIIIIEKVIIIIVLFIKVNNVSCGKLEIIIFFSSGNIYMI